MEYVICQICKQQFATITNTHLKKHGMSVKQYQSMFPDVPSTKTKYISLVCANHGSKNPNWKGGVSGFHRQKILLRDDHTCQLCGSKEDLCVHTIDHRKNPVDPKNSITVCRDCLVKTRTRRHRVRYRNELLKKERGV